jgi:hypothetical protein
MFEPPREWMQSRRYAAYFAVGAYALAGRGGDDAAIGFVSRSLRAKTPSTRTGGLSSFAPSRWEECVETRNDRR